jgi:hypothetical protein
MFIITLKRNERIRFDVMEWRGPVDEKAFALVK